MDWRQWPDADAILDEVLALPASERQARLAERAGEDADLLAALSRVLDEAERADDFLAPPSSLTPLLTDGSLSVGDQLEHYEILGPLGRGGMGEVYRARDLRLGREVALKVLPVPYAAQADRTARFRREAQVLASLSHPNIAAIFGVAEDEGLEALVLELVEGRTLADRLSDGPIPVSEAMAIARQLVDALDSAHARGVLHRDLKPANIKMTPDGSVKVLDFGLAKVLAPLAVDDGITAQHPEVRLGTAPYMSPEQVRGRAVDVRADIWAFGCVLYEMLTGTRAFGGQSSADVMARILERTPSYAEWPPDAPASLRRLVRRCLEKAPERRLGYIGDARLDLEVDETEHPEQVFRSRTGYWLAAGIAIGLLVGAAGIWGLYGVGRTAPTESRLSLMFPDGDQPVTGYQPSVALSPDGRTVVYRASHDGTTRLFKRPLASLTAEPVAGTEGATGPFFSPDGRWLAFDAGGVIKRVPIEGGPAVEIAEAPGGATAAWLDDDTIVFATNTSRVLQQVPVAGGAVTPLTKLDADRGETLHLLPEAVPGQRAVLFTITRGAERELAWVSLDGGEVHRLGEGSHARILSGSTLVFARAGALWRGQWGPGVPSLQPDVAPLLEGIDHTDQIVFHYDVAPDGTLAYLPERPETSLSRLVWYDRSGQSTAANLAPGPYTRVALSPDGQEVALSMRDRGNTDVWVGDLRTGSLTRLTTDPAIDTAPIWSPQGNQVVYRSERSAPGLFRRDAQGAGDEVRITTTDGPIHSPYGWTPDGRTVLFSLFRSFNRQAIASVTPPSPDVQVLLEGEFAQVDPQVSPDGHWLAYQSDETGRFEIYVRSYPNVGAGRWTVSTQGATTPRWSVDGRELYAAEGGALVSVGHADGETFAPHPTRLLFRVEAFEGRLGRDYEVGPGNRFLVLESLPRASAPPAQVVVIQGLTALIGSSPD